ncbi:ATP-binding cassette domain-containing protein [Streptomyces griseus]|uniref:ATP-binding cassette domain-containing protein n=1 Tax=Streptomyces stephensoniae TaxID=3375367 RepID=A0ABU2WBG7_9ACTN|nr:ATP-binding cassette domain-containing protein [Streptomyces griseus]MDT0495231.1 ATP-binding cassette domain-containing protein [Streptomyces griseus]
METSPHDKAYGNLSTRAIAARLPRSLKQAAILGWRTDRTAVLTLLFCQIAAAALTASALAATARVLTSLFAADELTEGLTHATPALIVTGASVAGRYLFDLGAHAAAARLAPKAVREADLAVIAASTDVELSAYEHPDFEDAQEAASSGAEKTGDLITDTQVLTGAAAQLLAAAVVVSTLHWIMLPLLVLSVLPCGWGAVRGARIEHAAKHRNLSDSRLRNVLRSYTTDRNNADEVRAGTMAPFLTSQYRIVSQRLENEQLTATRHALLVQTTGDALGTVATVGTWAALVFLVSTGRMDLAAAGAAVIAVRTSTSALRSLVRAGASVFRTSLSLDDWAKFLTDATTWRCERGTSTIPDDGPDTITTTEVSFTYPGADRPALHGVDLHIRRGEVIALVGENGSGKSTLARLLTGLFLPTTGTVRWNSTDLADADPASVWSHVGLVPQDYTRWPMAARENITLGSPRPEGDAAVHEAAEHAGADQALEALPHGLDTSLARSWWGGHDLSGGQWQRIAVARAFHRNAAVLIMDEPTAAMDARAEHRIFNRLKTLARGRTTLFITHRLDNARLADRIVVLNEGRIVESGTFDELLGLGGHFFVLHKLQADR